MEGRQTEAGNTYFSSIKAIEEKRKRHMNIERRHEYIADGRKGKVK
jgi:hypothetical protein